MTATRRLISGVEGLLEHFKAAWGHIGDPDKTDELYVDVPKDIERLFEFVVQHPKIVDSDTDHVMNDPIYVAVEPCKVKSAYFIPETSIADSTANYGTIQVKVGTDVAASFSSNVAANELVTDTPSTAFVLDQDYIEMDAGDVLFLVTTKTGAGVALPKGKLQVNLLHN